MRRLILGILLSCYVDSSQSDCFENDLAYRHNDVYPDVKGKGHFDGVTSPEDCQQLCVDFVDDADDALTCEYFTYRSSEAKKNPETCWLKTAIDTSQETISGVISGPKVCPDCAELSQFAGMTCSASSESLSTKVCENAIDGDSNTDWATDGEGTGAWIQINFGDAYKVKVIKIKHRATGTRPADELFRDIVLDFSDGSQIGYTLNDVPYSSGLVWNEVDLTVAPISSYVKITATSVYGTINNGFSEIEIYGCSAGLHDECALGTHNCDPNAACTDTVDAYTCNCNSGYVGDGATCAVMACELLIVGNSQAATMDATATLASAEMNCPEYVDINNWDESHVSGGYDWPDTFCVEQDGTQITAHRTDTVQAGTIGWGMDLRFSCCNYYAANAAVCDPLDCSLYWWNHEDSKMTADYRSFYNDGNDGSLEGDCNCRHTTWDNIKCYANSPYCMNKAGNRGHVECLDSVEA